MSTRKNLLLPAALTAAAGLAVGTAATAYLATSLLTRKRSRPSPLAGKVVVITGSSRGLGLALAMEFGRAGAKLVLAARDPEELNRAQKKLAGGTRIASEDILVVPCDLTQAGDAVSLISRATARFGRVDIVINNAGVITVGPVENQTLENFRNAMDTNFYGTVHTTLAVLPQMLARRSGSIVNIASIGGKIAVPHLLPYSASKFAVVGFSQGLHSELRTRGIRVTTVCPGLMRTDSHLHALFTGDRQREYRWFSLGASLPGVSTSAAGAARKIFRATLTGAAEITISPQAWLAAHLASVAPAVTAKTLSLANRILPSPESGHNQPREGRNSRGQEIAPLIELGQQAAQRYNEGA